MPQSERQARYYRKMMADPERRAAHQQHRREYSAKNRERINAYQRKYRNWRKHGEKYRRELIAALGGKCVRCGFSDWRALQVDHVYGDGAEERRVMGRNAQSYKRILNNLESGRYQLLCANCNWIKRYENKEHTARKP